MRAVICDTKAGDKSVPIMITKKEEEEEVKFIAQRMGVAHDDLFVPYCYADYCCSSGNGEVFLRVAIANDRVSRENIVEEISFEGSLALVSAARTECLREICRLRKATL